MKKLSALAVVALALFSTVAFGSAALARESGRNDQSRSESRSRENRENRGNNVDRSATENENNVDNNGTTTDDGSSVEMNAQ